METAQVGEGTEGRTKHRDETGPNRHNKNHRIRNVKNENSEALGTKDREPIHSWNMKISNTKHNSTTPKEGQRPRIVTKRNNHKNISQLTRVTGYRSVT